MFPDSHRRASDGAAGWFRGGVSLASVVQIVVVFAGVTGAGYVLKYRVDQIEGKQARLIEIGEAQAQRQEKLERNVMQLTGEVRALRELLFEKHVLRAPSSERNRTGRLEGLRR